MPDYRVHRQPAPHEPVLGGLRHDYADSFRVDLDRPDQHSAEDWARTSLEGSHQLVRRLVQVVHARVLRFDLGPRDDGHILGWRILATEHHVLHIEAAGPLGRGAIVARRTSPTTAVASTYVFFLRRRARFIWAVVGPLHRRVAPYLLARAARTMVRDNESATA